MGRAGPPCSSRDRRFRHLLDDLQALDLLIAEDDVPDGIRSGAQAVGGAEAKTLACPPTNSTRSSRGAATGSTLL